MSFSPPGPCGREAFSWPRIMLEVSCAVILRSDGMVLAALRGPAMRLPGLWEFPGGKIEPGESSDAALVREIREELGVTIRARRSLPPVDHQYPDFSIRLYPWICEITDGVPEPVEHAEIRWLDAAALPALDWAPADLPVLESLLELARSPGNNPDLRRMFAS